MQKQITQVVQTCSKCGKTIATPNEGGTGYALDEEKNTVCYACCAIQDREYMLEHGVIDLYLTKRGLWVVQNWPGTLVIPVTRISEGKHNIAGIQRHVWFRYEGEDWHGLQVGNLSEVCRCKQMLKSVG
jgi:hypothetical protein